MTSPLATNAQSRAIEEALRRLNVPYRIYGGLSFYKRKEVKDLLAYFRLVINHNDDEALLRIINFPTRGIGKTSIEAVIAKAGELNISLWEVISNPTEAKLTLNQGTLKKISEFATMIQSFATEIKRQNAYEVAKKIASSTGILKELFQDQTPEGISRYENIEELLNGIKEFSESERLPNFNFSDTNNETNVNTIRTLDEFMLDIALLTDADTDDKGDNNKVSLMTIHGAKGLEFPYVFISGLEENLFPSILSLNTREELEEERRLFYVALTRAKVRLFLSYAESRYRYGEAIICEPSRFLSEIDEKYIETYGRYNSTLKKTFPNNKPKLITKQKSSSINNFVKKEKIINSSNKFNDADDSKLVKEGMMVEHQRFGIGKVLKIEGAGANKKASVFFDSVGEKQLLLKFAKLLIIT
jgi:DNA helicase-2/ATP-dependent DNA helicase PcrA